MYSQEVYDAAMQAIRGAVSCDRISGIVRNEVSNVASSAIREAIYSGTFDDAIKSGILEAAQRGGFDDAIRQGQAEAALKPAVREVDAMGNVVKAARWSVKNHPKKPGTLKCVICKELDKLDAVRTET